MTSGLSERFQGPNADYAVRLVHSVCCMAGAPEFFNGYRRAGKNSLVAAIKARDTGRLFDLLVDALSYQGIADQIAFDYMQAHGRARWADMQRALDAHPPCPKLQSYWQFYDCRYQKGSASCAEPQHMAECLLPTLPLRNGHLNQMAYSLFLFIRDIAAGDLVGWIDGRLAAAERPNAPDRLDRMRAALLDPLRCIYGVSDKVLSTSLSGLLLAAGKERPLWAEVGAGLIAIDTLVHNFLHRDRPSGPPAVPACLWPGLLSGQRLRRHRGAHRGRDRRTPVQPQIPEELPTFRAARHLALLRRQRPRRL